MKIRSYFQRRLILGLSFTTLAFSEESYAFSGMTYAELFAPSPQRELKRAWDGCISGITWVILNNGKSLDDMSSWGFASCDDEESRLTGSLIKQYGYKRGNAAIQYAKDAVLKNVAVKLQARDLANNPPNLFGRTESGWRVYRRSKSVCFGVLEGGGPFDPQAVSIQNSTSGIDLTFLQRIGSDRRRNLATQSTIVDLVLYSSRDSRVVQQKMTVGSVKDGYLFTTPTNQQEINAIDRFESITLRIPTENISYSFQIVGIAKASTMVDTCSNS